MSTELKRFLLGETQNTKQINVSNIQILMRNIKYYCDCDRFVKYIESFETEISHERIIDIINENLAYYYASTKW